ncbi:unnamed protein product [Dicrocoelium dendriticum]|nr:unnamed protein product [Dicrocoelium dendriticum]
MSVLLFFLIKCYFVTEISSETFTTGVGLFTDNSVRQNSTACFLLLQHAEDVWKIGGLHTCISHHPTPIGRDLQIIPFSISVDSEAFNNFPEHGYYFEQLDFINKILNAGAKSCVTVTGSDWWIEQDSHGKQQAHHAK